jgi:hypothetical protein
MEKGKVLSQTLSWSATVFNLSSTWKLGLYPSKQTWRHQLKARKLFRMLARGCCYRQSGREESCQRWFDGFACTPQAPTALGKCSAPAYITKIMGFHAQKRYGLWGIADLWVIVHKSPPTKLVDGSGYGV